MQVCVPFEAADALLFDPEAVPTVEHLLEEYAQERSRRQAQSDSAIPRGQVSFA